MFVLTTQNFKQLPLKTKIWLFLGITLGITLLVLFGLTFLVIALVGGIITWMVNLFRGPRSESPPLNYPFPPRRPRDNPFPENRPPSKYDDDDVIDI